MQDGWLSNQFSFSARGYNMGLWRRPGEWKSSLFSKQTEESTSYGLLTRRPLEAPSYWDEAAWPRERRRKNGTRWPKRWVCERTMEEEEDEEEGLRKKRKRRNRILSTRRSIIESQQFEWFNRSMPPRQASGQAAASLRYTSSSPWSASPRTHLNQLHLWVKAAARQWSLDAAPRNMN